MNRTLIILASIGLMACIWYGSYIFTEPTQAEEATPIETIWSPTEEDQCYIDSLWVTVNNTQCDVDTIKIHMDTIMMKLDQLHDE